MTKEYFIKYSYLARGYPLRRHTFNGKILLDIQESISEIIDKIRTQFYLVHEQDIVVEFMIEC